MASAFATIDTDWYIRTGGNELNGGGFCPFQASAGTNYADQDAAQLSLTDLTTVGVSASVSSVTGGFTSQMIGNVMRIASGTNFTADYYVLTAVADTNNATLDRNCATGVGVSGVCRVGGAFVHLKSLATGSLSGGNLPTLLGPLVTGNNVYIRGDGTQDPSAVQYDWKQDAWILTNGGFTSGNGNIRFIGYNGRPLIGHFGILFWHGNFWGLENISFKQTLGTWTSAYLCDRGGLTYYNCIFDQGGNDSVIHFFGTAATQGSGALISCEIRNTGGGAGSVTGWVTRLDHGGAFLYATWYNAPRGGVSVGGVYGAVHQCLFTGMSNTLGAYYDREDSSSAPIPVVVMNCTFNGNAIAIQGAANSLNNTSYINTIISNQTGTAVTLASSLAVNSEKYGYLFGFNDYYGNSSNFGGTPTWAINPASDSTLTGDLTLDPQYTNTASKDFHVGANLLQAGLALPPNLPTTAKLPMGAMFR